jgi:guanylate kinase
MYGTLFSEVESKRSEGKHVVLVIDTQGAFKIKRQIPEAVMIFISPPSMEELKNRLVKRGTEIREKLEQRLAWATVEMGLLDEYEYHIINENLNLAYEILKSIFVAEAHRMPKESINHKKRSV